MENINYTMNSLEEGRWGRVIRLDTKGDMRRRLQDIGLVEGTMVKSVRRSCRLPYKRRGNSFKKRRFFRNISSLKLIQ